MIPIVKRYFYRAAAVVKINFVAIRSNNFINKGILGLNLNKLEIH